ncbi:DMT family transporter [Bacillota bacterium]
MGEFTNKSADGEIEDDTGKQNRLKVYGAALLFSFIVGFSFLGVKASIAVATPLEVLTYRFNFAALGALLPVVAMFVKINIKGKPLSRLIVPAGFYIGFMIFQVIGLRYSSSIESGIIFAIIPIFAKIIAQYYLGEKGDWKENIFVCLSIASVIAMFVFSATDFGGVNIQGILLLLLSSVLMALSNVLMRGVRRDFSPYSIAFAIALGGCLVFNAATIAAGIASGEPTGYFEPLRHWEFIVATAFLGIPSTLISSLLMAYMLANMEAVKATVFGNLSTGISIVAGVLFLKETLELYHIICTIFIIVGVIGTSMGSRRGVNR